MTSIFDAIRARDQTALGEYLETRGAIDARDSNGMTALIRAVDDGCDSIVKFLLDHKASPNLTGRWGQTALMLAAGRNNARCAKLLLASGAELNIRAKNGVTAIQYATENRATEVARILAEARKRPIRNDAGIRHGKRRVSDGTTGKTTVFE